MADDRLKPPCAAAALRIRAAQLRDVADLLAIEAAAFATDRLSRRSFRHLLASPSARLLVAKLDGRIAGYALLLLRRGGRTARLYSLAVASWAKGGGLGSALLAAAEQSAGEAGAMRLALEVRADNAVARRLYERRGYAPAGRIEAYYADGAPALRFVRQLGASVAALGRAA